MKIRPDIADMLRNGMTYRQIMAEAHVPHRTITATRLAYGIPPNRAGLKPQTSLEQAFRDRARTLDDGHMEWAGQYDGPIPVFRFNHQRYTARRAAFIVRYGRQPVGEVKPGCDRDGCVAPAHVEDQPMRKQTAATYAAIFGGAS